MDKQSILKFFTDNTQTASQQVQAACEPPLQIINQDGGNVVVNLGDHATTNIGCAVQDNQNLTCADKAEINALIKSLEEKNAKGV